MRNNLDFVNQNTRNNLDFVNQNTRNNLDFVNQNTRNATTLSTYIWKLKEENVGYETNFEIVGMAAPFFPVSATCNLCVSEKFEIIFNPQMPALTVEISYSLPVDTNGKPY
jgi:hypothetical protein